MKSLKTQLLLKGVAAVLAAGGIAATASAGFTGNQIGTPDDGMVCRSGYTPSFNGTSLKCSKSGGNIEVQLECANPTFPTYQERKGAPDKLNGPKGNQDLCVKLNNPLGISATSSIAQIGEQNYELAQVKTDTINKRASDKNHSEAVALGLTDAEVETVPGTAVIQLDSGNDGVRDKATAGTTQFTFAVKTSNGPIILH